MSECGAEGSQVYVGYDNTVTVVPYSDITSRIVYDMTDVSRVEASIDLLSSVAQGDDITATSDDVPTTIWWELVDTEWRIHFKIGMFVGVAAGDYKLRIILFDPTHTNGLVLSDEVLVEVVATP